MLVNASAAPARARAWGKWARLVSWHGANVRIEAGPDVRSILWRVRRPILRRRPASGAARPGAAGRPDRALREAVRSGRLAPGTRLPPYRSLAADLGVARNTVAEGTPSSSPRAGSPPARARAPGSPSGPRPPPAAHRRSHPTRPARVHDLLQGQPDPRRSRAPRGWPPRGGRSRRPRNEAFGPGDPHGRLELRQGAGRLPGPGTRRVRRARSASSSARASAHGLRAARALRCVAAGRGRGGVRARLPPRAAGRRRRRHPAAARRRGRRPGR